MAVGEQKSCGEQHVAPTQLAPAVLMHGVSVGALVEAVGTREGDVVVGWLVGAELLGAEVGASVVGAAVVGAVGVAVVVCTQSNTVRTYVTYAVLLRSTFAPSGGGPSPCSAHRPVLSRNENARHALAGYVRQ